MPEEIPLRLMAETPPASPFLKRWRGLERDASPASARRLDGVESALGATHFLMKTLPRVAGEMAVHVLTYNITRRHEPNGEQAAVAAIAT